MDKIITKYFIDRKEWRKWLKTNFETKDDIWLEYPLKKTGRKRILYNDAVEEALCFGWIDSTVKSLNEETTIQRFCRRRKNSSFSQPNIERLKGLFENNLIHESIKKEVLEISASLEQHSSHVIGVAIKKYALENGTTMAKVDDFKNIAGKGITGKIKGKDFFIGNKTMMEQKGVLDNKARKQYLKLSSLRLS